jgi:glutaredoxin 3
MSTATVYTTSRCPYCVMLKNFLADQNIPYKEVNVETTPGMMEYVVKNTGQMGVPQTEINGQWVLGYDPQNIILALNN